MPDDDHTPGPADHRGAQLRHTDPLVRLEAAESLARAGDTRGIGALLSILASEEDRDLWVDAIAVLDVLPPEAVTGPLLDALGGAGTGPAAAYALARLNPEALLAVLLEEDDLPRRRLATQGLAHGATDAMIPDLLHLLVAEPNLFIRALIPEVLEHLPTPAVIAALTAAMADPQQDITVRENCAWTLGDMHAEEAAGPLADALTDDHADLRASAVYALGQVGDAEAVELVLAAVDDEDEGVRYYAVDAAARLMERGVVEGSLIMPVLVEVIEDVMGRPTVRLLDHMAARRAARTLESLDLPRGLAAAQAWRFFEQAARE
ncbi:MAG: hypothetical protein GYB64_14945 [Chloroflexi bacterium]|nr:hypothetical protein [Chloroflexota bacterium]